MANPAPPNISPQGAPAVREAFPSFNNPYVNGDIFRDYERIPNVDDKEFDMFDGIDPIRTKFQDKIREERRIHFMNGLGDPDTLDSGVRRSILTAGATMKYYLFESGDGSTFGTTYVHNASRIIDTLVMKSDPGFRVQTFPLTNDMQCVPVIMREIQQARQQIIALYKESIPHHTDTRMITARLLGMTPRRAEWRFYCDILAKTCKLVSFLYSYIGYTLNRRLLNEIPIVLSAAALLNAKLIVWIATTFRDKAKELSQ